MAIARRVAGPVFNALILCFTRGKFCEVIDNSRTPRPIKRGAKRGSPAISPQMLTGFLLRCAAWSVICISCSTAGCKGLKR